MVEKKLIGRILTKCWVNCLMYSPAAGQKPDIMFFDFLTSCQMSHVQLKQINTNMKSGNSFLQEQGPKNTNIVWLNIFCKCFCQGNKEYFSKFWRKVFLIDDIIFLEICPVTQIHMYIMIYHKTQEYWLILCLSEAYLGP